MTDKLEFRVLTMGSEVLWWDSREKSDAVEGLQVHISRLWDPPAPACHPSKAKVV